MHTSSLTQKGQVTIPAEMRRALGLKTGSRVRFSRKGKRLALETVEEPLMSSIFGILKAPQGRSVPDVNAALANLRKTRHGRRSG